jgi:hypothetical protein
MAMIMGVVSHVLNPHFLCLMHLVHLAPEDLPRILQEFATDKTPLKERCEILAAKHNYTIRYMCQSSFTHSDIDLSVSQVGDTQNSQQKTQHYLGAPPSSAPYLALFDIKANG